ncbi:helicase-associated domain-containing protein [Microbacterium marinilacus]|uniref:Helicase XPB/Ssl2 N-terminal domain-containing protein n=1 Tax=Microbacterium marinilacus TaxID=415209 RepID=A0ABP7BE14_9MICO|nr:helicase-associated domain-containing protein [Microbacterium marinilacus]MBY0688927.1 helicase-associated domain-containing protein [Microbacterium marinilacus]
MNTTDSRALAERLATADDREIADLLLRRRVSGGSGWHDFFDAAEALLAPEAVARAVSELPRDALAALAEGTGPERLGLTDPHGTPYAQVRAALGGVAPLPTPASTPPRAGEAAAAHAAERAFTTTSALADLLLMALRTPLSRVGTGAVGAADRRRMAQEEIVRDADDADDLVALAEAAELLTVSDRHWLVSAAGAEWVRESTGERWARVAAGLRSALPDGVRSPSGGWIDPALWDDAYPLDETWPERASRWRRLLRLAGLAAEGDGAGRDAEPAWATPVREGGSPDPGLLVALLPREVDKVFLQNDLTAISPGPLAPALDVRLQSMAARESHAQASTYRFTEASIAGALSAGETADDILGFLSELSLTGVPQPLAYLVQRIAERHGLVRVSVEPDNGHTVVSSRDHALLQTIAVDQALRALGLVPDGRLLRTRASRDAVYWALADARYPVVALDEEGGSETLDRGRVAREPAPEDARSRYAALIDRMREAHGTDADAAWLERELETAVRTKSLLEVTVALPDGSARTFTLEATGLGGGRLRGRDRGADVERTLPVKSITGVRPL